MRAKDFRARAWNALRGNWSTMVLIGLVYSLISGAGSSLSFIIAGPLMLGFVSVSLNFMRGRYVELEDVFDGFSNFANSLLLWLVNSVFTFLWSLLFIIPGIVKGYAYSMSFYIMADNYGISPSEARRQSIEMMRGNKWRLFCLHCSFIGWGILCVLTLGILSFWVLPYMQAAEAEFYRELKGELGNNA